MTFKQTNQTRLKLSTFKPTERAFGTILLLKSLTFCPNSLSLELQLSYDKKVRKSSSTIGLFSGLKKGQGSYSSCWEELGKYNLTLLGVYHPQQMTVASGQGTLPNKTSSSSSCRRPRRLWWGNMWTWSPGWMCWKLWIRRRVSCFGWMKEINVNVLLVYFVLLSARWTSPILSI